MGLGYSSVKLAPDQEADLINDLTLLGLPSMAVGEYHCTMMYDKRESLTAPLCDFDDRKVFDAFVQEIVPLGNALVFNLTSQPLTDEFLRLKNAGYQHSFDDLYLHMSIFYDFSAYDAAIVDKFMGKWVGRQVQFGRLSLKPVKD